MLKFTKLQLLATICFFNFGCVPVIVDRPTINIDQSSNPGVIQSIKRSEFYSVSPAGEGSVYLGKNYATALIDKKIKIFDVMEVYLGEAKECASFSLDSINVDFVFNAKTFTTDHLCLIDSDRLFLYKISGFPTPNLTYETEIVIGSFDRMIIANSFISVVRGNDATLYSISDDGKISKFGEFSNAKKIFADGYWNSIILVSDKNVTIAGFINGTAKIEGEPKNLCIYYDPSNKKTYLVATYSDCSVRLFEVNEYGFK